jgi:hypothetical protein
VVPDAADGAEAHRGADREAEAGEAGAGDGGMHVPPRNQRQCIGRAPQGQWLAWLKGDFQFAKKADLRNSYSSSGMLRDVQLEPVLCYYVTTITCSNKDSFLKRIRKDLTR